MEERASGGMGMGCDPYSLVQAAVYHGDGFWGTTTFDLGLHHLPEPFGYAVAAGVEDAVESALELGFSAEEVAWIRELPAMRGVGSTFFRHLEHVEFTGEIRAVAPGTVVFADEPILSVTAPLGEAILLEGLLLRKVALATAVATRAARMVDVARGRRLVDLSSTRWGGEETAALVAAAASVGGFSATSNLGAARRYGLQVEGSLGGTFQTVYEDEPAALEALRLHAAGAMQVLLPEEDPRNSVGRIAHLGEALRWIRVPGGNHQRYARLVRDALDAHGLQGVRIFATGVRGEEQVLALARAEAPVDVVGVGSGLMEGISPLVRACSYRLAEQTRGATPTPAQGRASACYPGRKQVIRHPGYDWIGLEREVPIEAGAVHGDRTLLHTVVSRGRRIREPEPLEQARDRRLRQVAALDPGVRRLRDPQPYPVEASELLATLALS